MSECITLQTLHRHFRPGTPCVGLILKTYSRQNFGHWIHIQDKVERKALAWTL